ncbi:MAG: hypothetical protein SA339_08325 [Methanomassiliicoccus sp.]|nr:hypothetical protein [Methanomassiliicoccus sp.]
MKDRKGAMGLAVSALIVIMIVIIAGLTMYVIAGDVLTGNPDDDTPYKPGDNSTSAPIFAYFTVVAHCKFDNSQYDNHVIYGLNSIDVTWNSDPSSESMTIFDGFGKLADWFTAHDAKYKVTYKVTSPAEAGYSKTYTATGEQHVGALQSKNVDVSMPGSPGIRYEGPYTVLVTLFDGDGNVVSSLSKTVQVTK